MMRRVLLSRGARAATAVSLAVATGGWFACDRRPRRFCGSRRSNHGVHAQPRHDRGRGLRALGWAGRARMRRRRRLCLRPAARWRVRHHRHPARWAGIRLPRWVGRVSRRHPVPDSGAGPLCEHAAGQRLLDLLDRRTRPERLELWPRGCSQLSAERGRGGGLALRRNAHRRQLRRPAVQPGDAAGRARGEHHGRATAAAHRTPRPARTTTPARVASSSVIAGSVTSSVPAHSPPTDDCSHSTVLPTQPAEPPAAAGPSSSRPARPLRIRPPDRPCPHCLPQLP